MNYASSLEQTRDGFPVLQRVVGVGEVSCPLLESAATALMPEHAADTQRSGGAVASDGAAPSQALQLIVTQTWSPISNVEPFDEVLCGQEFILRT